MYQIKRTAAFAQWLDGLKDRTAKARLIRRLEKAAAGNLGDVKAVGSGVNEMREFFGPGWRMYYTKRGATLIIMLGGGDKSSQANDIAKAIQLAASLED
ncbi:MAG TPA: type II toxin-antitoxin system RelE/ParE family toxin [Gammaproteobacteria bacterium]|nr:type II toxin-antitoxin system RelE/ParE family toxin [Gammaproteobacteria bacterium]